MNIRSMKISLLFLIVFFVIFSFPVLGRGAEEESFRTLLNNALKYYIEQNYGKVVEELDKASIRMRNIAPLKVEVLTFCENIDMFAKYTPKKDTVFSPGETFLLYFQPGNYSLKKVENGWEINLEESYEITDENGKIVAKLDQPLKFHVVLLSPLTTGLYFKNTDFVPTKPGKYILKVILKDVIKGKELIGKLSFEVKKE